MQVNYLFMNIFQNLCASDYFHIYCKMKIPDILKADLIMIFVLNTTHFNAVSKTFSCLYHKTVEAVFQSNLHI